MPPRQGHKKSRTGCARCKVRKVKCDEKRPVCTGCLRNPEDCNYEIPAIGRSSLSSGSGRTPDPEFVSNLSSSTSTRTHNSPANSLPNPYSTSVLGDIDPERRRQLELLLLHHYSTITVPQFPSGSAKWLLEGIHLALEHDCLLYAIFAVAALHAALVPLNRPGPNHDFDFEQVHRIYLNMAVRAHRQGLSSLNQDNAEALSWTAVMLSHVSLKLLPNDNAGTYSVPYEWLQMTRAIATMHQATRQWLPTLSTLDFMAQTSGPDFRNDSEVYDYAFSEPFQNLLNFDDGQEILDEATYASYQKTLAYVYKTYTSLIPHPEGYQRCFRRVFALGPMSSESFIRFLEEGRPRALAVLAHHCALMKVLNEVWCFKGVAEREIKGISSLLPSNWQWAMAWPRNTYLAAQPISGKSFHG